MMWTGMTVLAGLAAVQGVAPTDRAADIAALTEAKEIRWNGFYRERDAEGLSRFLADGFVHLSADGARESKGDAVAYVRDNEWPGATNNFVYEVTGIEFYGENVANVYGNGRFDGSVEEAACRMQYASSNIFIREDGDWRPIFSHSSPAFCPERETN